MSNSHSDDDSGRVGLNVTGADASSFIRQGRLDPIQHVQNADNEVKNAMADSNKQVQELGEKINLLVAELERCKRGREKVDSQLADKEQQKKKKEEETKCKLELAKHKEEVKTLIEHIKGHTNQIRNFNSQLDDAIATMNVGQSAATDVKGYVEPYQSEPEWDTNDEEEFDGWREGAEKHFTGKQRREAARRERQRRKNRAVVGGARVAAAKRRAAAAKRFLRHCDCDEKLTNGVEEAVCECLLSLNDDGVKMGKEDLKLLAKILRVPMRSLKGMRKAEVRVKLASRIESSKRGGWRGGASKKGGTNLDLSKCYG